MDAIREALLNSFCHKDYASAQSNEVAIYKDRVEIYNPGAFPEGYEPQDFIDKAERPIRRNPKIARMLYYSKDIESFGTGLKRIAEACDAAGVRYEFKKMKSGFVVCFYRSEEKADKKPIKADKRPIKVDRQEVIAQYVKEHGSISNMEARELLGLADSTVKRILKEMVDDICARNTQKGLIPFYQKINNLLANNLDTEDGILSVEGERKARRYLLKEEG